MGTTLTKRINKLASVYFVVRFFTSSLNLKVNPISTPSRSQILFSALLLVAAGAREMSAQVNIIQNGSFEQFTGRLPPPFWSGNFGLGLGITGTADGRNLADISYAGNYAAQTLTTIPGQTYHVSFAVSGNSSYPGLSIVQLTWNGTVAGNTTWTSPYTPGNGLNYNWKYGHFDLVATAPTTDIRFERNPTSTAGGTWLDDIRVTYSPVVPPTIACPGALNLECTNNRASGSLQVLVGDSQGNPLTVVWTVDGLAYQTNYVPSGGTNTTAAVAFVATYAIGNHLVVVSASQGRTSPATCSTAVTVHDTTAPTIICPVDVAVSANFGCTATNVGLGSLVASDNCGVAGVTNDAPASYLLGTNLVTWTATDGSGNRASCVQRVIVRDTTPPQIVRVMATPSSLWPPNHTVRPVHITAQASDSCGSVAHRIVSVTANEPLAADDWQILSASTLQLRATRRGNRGDRIYAIELECADAAGNTATRTVTVTVPHDKR